MLVIFLLRYLGTQAASLVLVPDSSLVTASTTLLANYGFVVGSVQVTGWNKAVPVAIEGSTRFGTGLSDVQNYAPCRAIDCNGWQLQISESFR